MVRTELELEVGSEHRIRLRPSPKVVDTIYIGNEGDINVFRSTDNEPLIYVFMNLNDIVRDDGVLTYHPVAAAAVDYRSVEKLKSDWDNPGLLKILRRLGEDI